MAPLESIERLPDLEVLINLILLFLLIAITITVIAVRNLLASALLLSIFSLLMAAMYLVLGAPDVAITEAAVGAGIGTIIFLAAMVFTGTHNKGPTCNLFWPVLVVCILGAALLYSTTDMPFFGVADAPVQLHVAPYYLSHTEREIGIPNVVTAVLASYRGFDTLGETIVVFTAAISILLLLGKPEKGDGK